MYNSINNDVAWMQGARLHRTRGPAKITEAGTVMFMWDNVLHRLNGPSMITRLGVLCYTNKDGEKHRLNGPAYINREGEGLYYVNGSIIPSRIEYFLTYGSQ